MRIKSPFRDYYDGVQAFGQDIDFVYLRQPKTIEVNYDVGFHIINHWPMAGAHNYIIGFCGKIYPVVRTGGIKPVFLYTIEDFDRYVDEYFPKKDVEYYYEDKDKYRYISSVVTRKKVVDAFQLFQKQTNRYSDLFSDNLSPIFVADRLPGYRGGSEIVFNERLGKYNFQKVFTPYQAYQEISMFMGNLAMPEKPIPAIADKIMAEIKGFDKWSFRKMPS